MTLMTLRHAIAALAVLAFAGTQVFAGEKGQHDHWIELNTVNQQSSTSSAQQPKTPRAPTGLVGKQRQQGAGMTMPAVQYPHYQGPKSSR